MSRIKKLINDLGGTCSVAERAGVKPQTVSSWISRDRIPYDNWEALIEIGATFEELRDLHRKNDSSELVENAAV